MALIEDFRPSHDDDPRNQQAIDHDPNTLIYPPLIPRPATIVENLREAIGTMGSAAGSISDSGHDIEDTWGALPNHYSAPGSDTLFSAMGRVSERGGRHRWRHRLGGIRIGDLRRRGRDRQGEARFAQGGGLGVP